MGKNFKDKVFNGLIWSFLILYICTASVSFYHCIEFCMVGNPLFLSVVMSFAFEVGLALTLFSILITEENKNNLVSWVLMTLLTCVQVMGNVYSVEKYMELSKNNFYVYIQNGFLHWFIDDMSQRDIMSIIAIILGALLPFVALLMTSMVARNWKNRVKEKEENEESKEQVETPVPTEHQEKSIDDELPIEEQEDARKKSPETVFDEGMMFSSNGVFDNTEQEQPTEQIPEQAIEEAKETNAEEIINDVTEPITQEVSSEPLDAETEPQDTNSDSLNSNIVSPDEPINEPINASESTNGSQLNQLINKAKNLAEERNNEILDIQPEITDGSLLTPAQRESMKQQVSMQSKPSISLFQPMNN